MPVSFHFLAYPLFYIYLQKISILENEKPSYWTLIPGMAEFLVGIAVFLLPLHIKTWIKDSNAMLIYFLLGMSYSLFIQFLSLKWIARHRREVEKQYSLLLHRNLKWSSYFVYASILFSILFLFMFITDNTLVYIFYSVINVILIYWISYQGFAQQNIAPLFTDLHMVQSEVYKIKKDKDVVGPAKNEALDVSEETNKPNSDEIEVYRNVVAKLQEHVVSSKCFTKEDLTIIDVSEAIKIHPRRISQSINSLMDTNFNNYINSFRVEYAKELLVTNKFSNLSIEGIGIEAGFHSKSTFYAAFKKIENTTPAQYRAI